MGLSVAELRASISVNDAIAFEDVRRPAVDIFDRFRRGEDLEGETLATLSEALTVAPRPAQFRNQFSHIEENGPSRAFLLSLRDGIDQAEYLNGHRQKVRTLVHAALVGQISAGVAADYVWRMMAVDFGRSISGSHVSCVGRDVEIRCGETLFNSKDDIDMIVFLKRMQENLNGRLHLVEHVGEDIVLRFPPLTVLEEATREVYGREAARWQYAPGEIPADDMNRAHARRRQPIGLALVAHYLEQAKRKVHPFVFAFHDLYHAVDKAGIHPELLKVAVALYDSVRALPLELQSLPFVEVQRHDLAELLHVRHMTLDGFLQAAFQPLENEARLMQYRIGETRHEGDQIACYRRYLDAVFSHWIGSLPGERAVSLRGHYRVLVDRLTRAA